MYIGRENGVGNPSLQEREGGAHPHLIKDDGDDANHFTEEGGASTPSLQGSIPSRSWR